MSVTLTQLIAGCIAGGLVGSAYGFMVGGIKADKSDAMHKNNAKRKIHCPRCKSSDIDYAACTECDVICEDCTWCGSVTELTTAVQS